APEERFRTLLTTRRRSRRGAASATAACSRAASALAALAAAVVCRRAKSAAALPIQQLEPLAVEQDFELLARHGSESGRRHVVAENRRHRDRVFAVGGEDMLLHDPAARAERQPFDV